MSTLIIGSTVCDVIIEVPHLPKQKEDVHILKQSFHIGGCAFNVSRVLALFGCEYVLFSPIGKGIYGDYIKQYFNAHHLPISLVSSKNNGCCYCLVDNTGERTFICEHGAEYQFQEEWFDLLDVTLFHQVYVCGLEIEENSGEYIIQFLEKNPQLKIYFAPGPRITSIDESRLERIFRLNPLVHLNEEELLTYTKMTDINEACHALYQKTHYPIVVTQGQIGALLYDGKKVITIPTLPVKPIDTIGAGDGHIGTIIACITKQFSLEESVDIANQVSSRIVQKKASTLTPAEVDIEKLIKKEL